MMRSPCRLSVTALLVVSACAQERTPPERPPQDPELRAAAEKLLAETLETFRKEGITWDQKAQTVAIQAEFIQPPDPLEYLLIHRRGKRHEALMITDAKPSVLNGALLLIGLQPGENADYKEKQPPPTLEEIEKGADPVIVTPPKGAPMWMTVRWKDKDGKDRELAVEDLLLELSTGKPMGAAKWVYLGGRMAPLYKGDPPVFVGDYEGNLISVCYMHPHNHLVTMSHERARDDQNWWVTEQAPEPGTKVEFVFHRIQPQVCIDRDARLAKAAKAAAEDGGKAPAKDGDK